MATLTSCQILDWTIAAGLVSQHPLARSTPAFDAATDHVLLGATRVLTNLTRDAVPPTSPQDRVYVLYREVAYIWCTGSG